MEMRYNTKLKIILIAIFIIIMLVIGYLDKKKKVVNEMGVQNDYISTHSGYKEDIITTTDITKTAKQILISSGYDSGSMKVLGACIDGNQTIHLTVKLNGLTSFATQGLYKMFGQSNKSAILIQTLEPFYKIIKKFYVKYPDALYFKMYYVKVTTNVVDKYGNKVQEEKETLVQLGMKKESFYQVNWDFIKDNMTKDILNNEGNIVINMLDEYENNLITNEDK